VEPAPTDHHGARRASAGAGIVVLRLVLAIAIGRLSQQVPLNSDQASSVLEGWAMAHGNVLLSGWTLPSDSFFTDKLPLLALLERFQGLTAAVEYEAAGLLGAAVVLAGIWLAGGRLRGRTRAVAMLVTGALLASQALILPGSGASFPSGVLLPAGTDHAGSLLLLLVACLALQGARRSRAWGCGPRSPGWRWRRRASGTPWRRSWAVVPLPGWGSSTSRSGGTRAPAALWA
jgi:hypothetical protein